MFISLSNIMDIANSQNKNLSNKLQMESWDAVEKEKMKDLQNVDMVKVKRYQSKRNEINLWRNINRYSNKL